jgi:uncharacterized membrane protein HdeD (DUF308 family)
VASPNYPSPFPDEREDLITMIQILRTRWRFVVGLGVASAGLGILALALVVSATIASVYMIAIFMILIGGAEITFGLSAPTWGRFFLWIIAGLAYIVAASFALAQPLIAAAFFTLLLGAGMIATGVLRIFFGAHLDDPLRAPVIFAGVLTLVIGGLIVASWPQNRPYILGFLLGLDLLFWGIAWIGLGLRLRRL